MQHEKRLDVRLFLPCDIIKLSSAIFVLVRCIFFFYGKEINGLSEYKLNDLNIMI